MGFEKKKKIDRHKEKIMFSKIHKMNDEYDKIEKLEKYMEENSNHIYSRLEYAKALRKNRRYDEAKQILLGLLNESKTIYALTEIVLVSFFLGEYAECLRYYYQLKTENPENSLNCRDIEIYCCYQLGQPINYNVYEMQYGEKSIVNYDPELSLKHIMHHTIDCYNKYNDDELSYKDSSDSFFNICVDVPTLFNNIRLILQNTNDDVIDELYKKYIFYYPNIGDNTKSRMNYFEVITILGTNNIITMYPCEKVDKKYIISGRIVYDYEEELVKLEKSKTI